MQIPHLLDILSDCYFFGVNPILVSLMEVSLLPQLFPSRNRLLSAFIGYLELHLELLDLLSEFYILVLTVSYQTYTHIMEGSLLL